jgi:hypothetical protein
MNERCVLSKKSAHLVSAQACREAFVPDHDELSDIQALAASIEQAVRKETLGGVENLSVELRGGTILLEGRCSSYYCKQQAQQVVMALLSDGLKCSEMSQTADMQLCNHIRVK